MQEEQDQPAQVTQGLLQVRAEHLKGWTFPTSCSCCSVWPHSWVQDRCQCL